MAGFLKSSDIESEATFPAEETTAAELIEHINEQNQLRTHFSANIAESVNNVKINVVKSEYANMINDMASLKKCYSTV